MGRWGDSPEAAAIGALRGMASGMTAHAQALRGFREAALCRSGDEPGMGCCLRRHVGSVQCPILFFPRAH